MSQCGCGVMHEIAPAMIDRAQFEARKIGMPGWRSRHHIERLLRAALGARNER